MPFCVNCYFRSAEPVKNCLKLSINSRFFYFHLETWRGRNFKYVSESGESDFGVKNVKKYYLGGPKGPEWAFWAFFGLSGVFSVILVKNKFGQLIDASFRPFFRLFTYRRTDQQEAYFPIEMKFYFSVMFLGFPNEIHEEKPWFLDFENNWLRTDQPMDRRTDRPSYRDARTYLKKHLKLIQ